MVQARAEGSREAQLMARLIVRKVRGCLVVEPYSDVVTQKEEGVKEYFGAPEQVDGRFVLRRGCRKEGEGGQKVCGLPRTYYAQSYIPPGGGGWDVMPEEERVTTYSGLVRVLRGRIASYVAEGIERARR